MTWWEIVRYANVALLAIVFTGMFRRFPMWATSPVIVRLYGLGLGGLVFGGAVAIVSGILRATTPTAAQLAVTVPLVWLSVATVWPAPRRQAARRRERARSGR